MDPIRTETFRAGANSYLTYESALHEALRLVEGQGSRNVVIWKIVETKVATVAPGAAVVTKEN